MAAEDAGAAAAIIINTEDRLMPMGDDAEHKPTIPSIHLPLSGGRAVRDAMTATNSSLWATLRPSHASFDSPDVSAPAACAAETPVTEDQKKVSDSMGTVHAAGSQACHDTREGLQGEGWCAAGHAEPAHPTSAGVKLRQEGTCELSDSEVQTPNVARVQTQVMTAPASSAQRGALFQAIILSRHCQLRMTAWMCTDDSKTANGHPNAAGRERLAAGQRAKVVSCKICCHVMSQSVYAALSS